MNLPRERMTVHFDIDGDMGTIRHEYWNEAVQRDRDYQRYTATGSLELEPRPAAEVYEIYLYLSEEANQ